MEPEANRRVLVIAYHYPPLAGAGVLKTLRTTRYLRQYGWDPLVLTVKNPEPYHQAPNPVPAGVRVYRSWRFPGGNLLSRVLRRLHLDERWLLLPDQHLFWLPATVLYGWFLILRHQIDLIYVTGPPYSALLAGALLKTFTGRPLAVEVRDPWTFNAARRGYPTGCHRLLDSIYERWVLRRADLITGIYRITTDGYRKLYPWTAEKLRVYYDTVDLADLPERIEPYPVFTLTYLGTFYPPFASLKATLAALKQLLDQGLITPERFRLNYVGPPDKTFERLVAEYGVETLVRRAGYQTLKAAQAEAWRSQMLLLLLEFATINTKLFDYLAAGRAVLAVVPDFPELGELLERYASGYARVTDNDPQKIADFIAKCYNQFYQGNLVLNHNKQQLFKEELNIEVETRALTTEFNRIIDQKERLTS